MDNKQFLKTLLTLSLPIALQNLLHSALGMLDTVMIGQLGEIEIGAVALGNQVFFLLILLMFGISSGAGIFTSQYWGKRDLRSVHAYQGIALMLGMGGALFFLAAVQIFPHQILGLYSKDPDVINLGAKYLRIVSISYPVTAVYFSYSMVLRSTGYPKLPLLTTFIGLTLNTGLNYILIFGKFGFPALGVTGAAIATLIARYIEGGLVILLTYTKQTAAAAPIQHLFRITKHQLQKFINRSAPVILNEIGWSVGTTLYMVIYGRMGTSVLAAFNIMDTVSRLAFVLFVGTGNGTAIILGNMLGRSEKQEARIFAKKILFMAPLAALVLGGLLLGLSGIIPLAFNVSTEVRQMAAWTIRVYALILAVKAINLHVVVGILRSGGDTKFSLFLDTAFLWFLGVPLAAVMGLILKWPLPVVYTAIGIEEVAKCGFGIWRTISGKWINTLTDEETKTEDLKTSLNTPGGAYEDE